MSSLLSNSSRKENYTGLANQVKDQIDSLFSLLAQQEVELQLVKEKFRRANIEVTLYGKLPPPDETAVFGFSYDTDYFLVATLELLIREQLFRADGTNRFSQDEVDFMKTAIYNVFETALGPYCIASCCESDLTFANILINLPDADQAEEQMLSAIDGAMQSAIYIVQKNYGITLVAARSPIVVGHSSLPAARNTAYNRLMEKYRLNQIANTGVVPSPSTERLPTAPQPNARLEKQYYQYILSRDLGMAKEALRALTAEDIAADGLSFEHARLRFMNHVESLLNIFGLAASDIGFLYMRPMETEANIYQLLDDLFADMEVRISTGEQALQTKIQSVAAYIRGHYTDCNLCLAMLCDQFQINQSHLSRTFKSVMQVGILDYIHTQRLLHAKDLLVHTAQNIDTIWQAVGYTNRRTFNRTFRKMEGMSASEYRKHPRPTSE